MAPGNRTYQYLKLKLGDPTKFIQMLLIKMSLNGSQATMDIGQQPQMEDNN